MSETSKDGIPSIALEATLKPTSTTIDLSSHLIVQGYDFNKSGPIDYFNLLRSYSSTGFQATHFGQACQQIDSMLENNSIIFFGYTSNMVSSGCRDIIRYLCQHKLIHVLVTTAGGIEEDFIKCLAPTYVGEFTLNGQQLRANGINRIGNLLVPNDNYCKFEDWLTPILDRLVDENVNNCILTPSKLIKILGEEINNEESIYYWCAKNDIPVFCPAITDGSLGDMLYFHSYRKPGLKIDILEDLKNLNTISVHAKSTGMLILGGGIVKHHICNANLMRNGADYAVYINTGTEYDGSDSGASPDEAISWGKIRSGAKPVKVHGDATLIFPLIVAQTFAQHVKRKTETK
ncbi:unnamed protein product [Adineta steineri]|uniref:deoxyhypusine synthase n=2 Tax=Adineta steineri TaxID=433720 RepID=A0A818X316_9BILA|nr:unnamed protein product [Adineta steineri]CAF3734256.1 unnamed protein product [Adineta steineri]